MSVGNSTASTVTEPSPLAQFDPATLAHYETVNWVAYYRKDWLTLMRASVGMVREAFSLSRVQAIYAAYLVARAEIAAAPFPNNDIPKAEAYMRRFYTLVRDVHGLEYDIAEAARVEVEWWVVHRQLFDVADKQPLVEALFALYRFYGAGPDGARKAAKHRTQAMVYSDEWIKEGKQAASPLIAKEEQELYACYMALKQALTQ